MNTVIIACRGAATLPLDELLPFQGELKTLPEENYRKLRDEIFADGFSEPVSVWQEPVDGSENAYRYHILNGHQRCTALKRMRDTEGFLVPEIPVSFVEASDLRQAKRKVLALTSQFGVMTAESLREFTVEAGLSFQDVSSSFRFAEVDLSKIETAPSGPGGGPSGEGEAPYTRKIKSPIYEPKSFEPPPVTELVDTTKADSILERISGATNVPEEVKVFLRAAAIRHSVFNYEKIAEFYAHAPKEVQTLMEDSALVIIDFEKAIENGFVILSEALAENYKSAE